MHYEKTINLKDGRRCLIRNATAHDAEDILLNLKKVQECRIDLENKFYTLFLY